MPVAWLAPTLDVSTRAETNTSEYSLISEMSLSETVSLYFNFFKELDIQDKFKGQNRGNITGQHVGGEITQSVVKWLKASHKRSGRVFKFHQFLHRIVDRELITPEMA